jgi:hypothetical protein
MPYLGLEFEHYNEEELLKVFKYIEENIVNDFTTPIINDVGAMMYYGKLTKYVQRLGIEDVDGFISNKVSVIDAVVPRSPLDAFISFTSTKLNATNSDAMPTLNITSNAICNWSKVMLLFIASITPPITINSSN